MSRADSIVHKWDCHEGSVNGEKALIRLPRNRVNSPVGNAYLYSRIPDGWQTIETTDSFVGILNEYTGESRDLVWETVPSDVRFQIDLPLL